MKKLFSILLAFVLLLSTMVFAQNDTDDLTNLQKSMDILEELGCNVKKDSQTLTFKSIKNDNKINLGNDSFALLDEDDRIISIDRIKETNEDSFRENTPKIDFRLTQTLVEKKLVKEGYELVQSGYFDDTTLRLRYEKMMPSGGHNQYDAYDVYIDTENGALVSFKKKGVEKEEFSLRSLSQIRNPISENKAISIANEFLKKYNKEPIQEVKIGTAIPNNDFFRIIKGDSVDGTPIVINEDNIVDQDIREVYILDNENLEVYVDLYSGELLGGDLFMYEGGSISVPDVAYGTARATDAHSGLARMGYDPVDVAASVTNFKSRANTMLGYGLKAFYAGCHGDSNVIGTNKNGGSFLKYNDVPSSNYQFVFLAACNTAANTNWSSAFGIYNGISKNKAFLGWYESINSVQNYNYCWQLWNQTSRGKSVRNAALDAANKITEYCPIRFRGDRSYDGFD